jgi:hypothetical protein
MDIPEHEGEIALAIRRFLAHRAFDTHGKRVGKVVRELHPRKIVLFWLLRLRQTYRELGRGSPGDYCAHI